MNDPDDDTNATCSGQADDEDLELTWQALEEANAGGPFASNDDVANWLWSWGAANELSAPQATIQF